MTSKTKTNLREIRTSFRNSLQSDTKLDNDYQSIKKPVRDLREKQYTEKQER